MMKRRLAFCSFLIAPLVAAASGCGTEPAPTFDYTTTSLDGSLGDLGPVQPIVSSLMIENSGETLVYLSTTPLSCNGMTISRWLGQIPPDSQVVELVLRGSAAAGTFDVPPNEVNYAKGGRSSAFEVVSDSGAIHVVTGTPGELIEGDFTVDAGADTITGSFHATFCDGGQGY